MPKASEPLPDPRYVIGFCPNEGPERYPVDETVSFSSEELAVNAGMAALNRPVTTIKAFRLYLIGDTYRTVCRIERDEV